MPRCALAAAIAVCLAACGAPTWTLRSSPSPTTLGELRSTGAPLGEFDFTPDQCILRLTTGSGRMIDFRQRSQPGLVLRVLQPDAETEPTRVRLGNRDAPGGAKELRMVLRNPITPPPELLAAHSPRPAHPEEGLAARVDEDASMSSRLVGCSVAEGYYDDLDIGLALRLDCTPPEGGHIEGYVAAGACR